MDNTDNRSVIFSAVVEWDAYQVQVVPSTTNNNH